MNTTLFRSPYPENVRPNKGMLPSPPPPPTGVSYSLKFSDCVFLQLIRKKFSETKLSKTKNKIRYNKNGKPESIEGCEGDF